VLFDFQRSCPDVSGAQKRGPSEISACLVAFNRFRHPHAAQLRGSPEQRVRHHRAARFRWVALAVAIAAVVAVVIALTLTGSTVAGSLAVPPGYSARELVFDYSATGSAANPIDWNSFLTSAGAGGVAWNTNGKGGSSPASYPNYDAEYDLPGQVSELNGVINIRATKTPTAGFIGDGPTVYPFASGVLSSYGKFEFTGGYVQIEAKMPHGAGLWPALWMLPGAGVKGADTYEIDIFEGGSNGGPGGSPSDVYAWHLHTPDGIFGAYTNSHVDLTAGFDTYGLKWIPGRSITWYLNGNVIGSVTSAQATIPDEPMELIMNLAVANASAASFHSVYNSTTPTTSDMLISAVQVYS
jgi:beta-glucanase (GH16 family)